VPRANGPAKIIMNTVISGSTGVVVAVFVKARVLGTYSFVNRYDCGALCNGALIGLVSITGCCDRVEPWAAFCIGAIGALFYVAGCKILDMLHVDDPVEAAPVHFFGGVWGTIATGFFDNQNGLFYDSPNKGTYFGYQILGIVCVVAWVGTTSSLFFYVMKRLGLLRIDKAIEIIGLDIAEMGGVGEDVYEKMRREFGGSISSPKVQSTHSPSQLVLNKSSIR
jgi:ammonium transporter, Amt family